MKIYYIKATYTSKELRKVYFKQLEVFCGEVDGNKAITTTKYKYNPKKEIWEEKTAKKEYMYGVREERILKELPSLQVMKENLYVYATLELAQAAKLLLTQAIAHRYKEAIQKLKNTYEENVPDVQKPIEILSKTYPEYFI